MKTIPIITIIVLLCNVIHAAVYLIPDTKHEGHPGKCYYEGPPELIINVGESVYSKKTCEKWSCGKDFTIDGESCGVIGDVPPPCKIVKDLSKPYPHCCGRIVCPKN